MRGQACMQTSQCLSCRSLQERRDGMGHGGRRRRMMMMRRRWRGRRGILRICRTAWWWRRAWLSNSPWSLLLLVSFPCRSCFKVLYIKKKLNNHDGEIQKKNQYHDYVVPPEAPAHLPLATLSFSRTVQPLCQELVTKVQPVLTHVGCPRSQPSLKNTARHIPGLVDGTQKNQIFHLINQLQDKDHL